MTLAQARTAADLLESARARTEPVLRDCLDRLDPGTRLVCGYHLGYWEPDGTPTDASAGKGIRGALALASARAAGGDGHAAVAAAAACELVHNFSLLHDDVMDGDAQRRHRATAWAVYDTSAAILAGDALLSLACELLAEVPSPTTAWAIRSLTAATRRLIAGQTVDLAFETRTDVTVDECLDMERDKTGALLACSASIGAVLADGSSAMALHLASFGAHLGLAFQLEDDLLGIWGQPERTGKPVLSDLRSRKKSAPVVAALNSGTDDGVRLAALYAREDELSEAELEHAAHLIERAGGRAWAEQLAAAELAEALHELGHAAAPPAIAQEMRLLARSLAGRDH